MTVRQVLIILIVLAAIALAEAVWLSKARADDCTNYDATVDMMMGDGADHLGPSCRAASEELARQKQMLAVRKPD